MRLTLIALLALAACSSQPPAADTNIVQSEQTNVTDDASPGRQSSVGGLTEQAHPARRSFRSRRTRTPGCA